MKVNKESQQTICQKIHSIISLKGTKTVIGLLLYFSAFMFIDIPLGYFQNMVSFSKYFLGQIFNHLLYLAATLGITWIFIKFWDKRSFVNLGLTMTRKTWFFLCFGILVTGILFSLVFIIQLGAGWISVKHFGNLSYDQILPDNCYNATSQGILGFLAMFVSYFLGSMTEEVMIRGYILQSIERGFGIIPALAISSLLWGFLHMKTHVEWLLWGFNLFLTGLFFGYSYLITRTLWVPVGLHLFYNFFQGSVFGFPVSGVHHPPELFQIVLQGPNIVTGGDIGPEGGVLVTIITLLIIVLMITFYPLKRNRSKA
ncbi:MAG: type II CAAX endopeptidase family protein [Bacillota bacterium]|nr:type II CAAX endopeptidase family protein [Bacillota bacterium]